MFLFFSFYFQRKSRFSWRGQHFKKILIVKEELDGIDIDDIGNVEDLLRIAFIHEECGNLKVFVDGWELIRNINKLKSQALYKLVDVRSVTNFTGESISSIRIWNIVNQ